MGYKDKADKIIDHPINPWKRTVARTEWGEELKDSGYRMSTKPKKSYSVFSVSSKLIASYVKKYLEEDLGILLDDEAGPFCTKLVKKLMSPITIYRMLFMKCVERWYFYTLYSMNPSPLKKNGDYKDFNAYVKKNPNKFWAFLKTNLLKPDMKAFKPIIIIIIIREVRARLFVKGEIKLDAPDPDDAIITLLIRFNIIRML